MALNHTLAVGVHASEAGVSFGGAGFLIFYYLGEHQVVPARWGRCALTCVHTSAPVPCCCVISSLLIGSMCTQPTEAVDVLYGTLVSELTGIAEMLSKLGVISSSTKLAGSSSGALITTSHCAGLPPGDIYNVGLKLAHSCRSHMSCSGTLDRQLRQVLQETLPKGGWRGRSSSMDPEVVVGMQ